MSDVIELTRTQLSLVFLTGYIIAYVYMWIDEMML